MDEDIQNVVILAGGKGTRMREHTEYIPKPMVEIEESHSYSHNQLF